MTTIVVVSLTIYAIIAKTDFTLCGGLFFVLGAALFGASLLKLMLPKSEIFEMIFSFVSLVIFGLYLVYDTQLIVGNKQNKFSIDDYIFAAMSLYIDIIQIFMEILKILGNHK